MKLRNIRQTVAIALSLLAGVFMSLLPLPNTLAWIRPQWVSLVLIYWVLFLPRTVGLLIAWLMGFWMDSFTGAVLGQYSLVFVLTAFLVNVLRRRLIYVSTKQSITWVMVLLGLGQILLFLVEWFLGDASRWAYHGSVWGVSLLAWPLVYTLLTRGHRVVSTSIH